MLVVGELINSTRKRIQPLLEARDGAALVDLARRQIEAGADSVAVNCATLMEDETACLQWAIRTIQDALEVRITIDSSNPAALQRGLEVHRGRAILDSINLESPRWSGLHPAIVEFKPEVVALPMDDQGIPPTAEGRLELVSRLVDGLTAAGVEPHEIYVDPLVFPVATDSSHAELFLETLGMVRSRFPSVRTICGLSNVSFGLPHRALINQTFLVLCMARGIDGFILDPLDRRLMANLVAAEMLLGRDEFCQRYIRAARAGKMEFRESGTG